LLRSGILAQLLAARGHEVVWWTSSFDHYRKRFRAHSNASLHPQPRLRIQLLHGPGYSGNVQLRRMLNHWIVGFQFGRLAPAEPRPDVILCSLPLPELCERATAYGRQRGVPVILDVRDMWPDVLIERAAWWMKPMVQVGFRRMAGWVRTATAQADGIVGISDGIVDWALDYAGRPRHALDRAFPLAYLRQSVPDHDLVSARHKWDQRGVVRRDGRMIVCFFGTMNGVSDLRTVVRAAQQLARDPQTADRFQFVLCGTGDDFEFVRSQAVGWPTIVLPGWVEAAEIRSLMERADVGVLPYPNRRDLVLCVPNKVPEYLSGSLAVATTLRGEMRRLIDERDCGASYPEGDERALAEALVALQADPVRLARLRRNAGAVYEERFVGEKVYAAMADYLEQVGRPGQPPAARPVRTSACRNWEA
jgi:glycosyltransferase involved in cell wall biosynthesis